MIFRNLKGKIIGELRDRIFRRVVDSRKHKMRIYDAYGIDSDLLSKLLDNCDQIRLLEKDTKQVYFTTPSIFNTYGLRKNFDGEQIFLPMKYWTKEEVKTMSLFT